MVCKYGRRINKPCNLLNSNEMFLPLTIKTYLLTLKEKRANAGLEGSLNVDTRK